MEWITKRCSKCRTILCKHEPGAFSPGRRVEIKCKCNLLSYIEGEFEAADTPNPTQGRTQADRVLSDSRSTDHARTERTSRQADR